MTILSLTLENACPTDGLNGDFVGRVWLPGEDGGPTPVLIKDEGVFDISCISPTISGLLSIDEPCAAVQSSGGQKVGNVADILANTPFQFSDKHKP